MTARQSQPTTEAEVRPVATPAGSSKRSSSRLVLAAMVFSGWLVLLISLAYWTANPVTLNRAQVREADLIVEGIVDDPSTGLCRVVRTWPSGRLPETIAIHDLETLNIQPGVAYLFPLLRPSTGTTYRIVPYAAAGTAPLVYPASEDSRSQLESILDARVDEFKRGQTTLESSSGRQTAPGGRPGSRVSGT